MKLDLPMSKSTEEPLQVRETRFKRSASVIWNGSSLPTSCDQSDCSDGINDNLSTVSDHSYESDDEFMTSKGAKRMKCSSQQREENRRVRFCSVQVKEYSVAFGDHPCSECYPLTLDWQHSDAKDLPLSVFEASKCCTGSRKRRRPVPLSATERRMRLNSVAGMSFDEIAQKEEQRAKQLEHELLIQCFASLDDDVEEEQTNRQEQQQQPKQPQQCTEALSKQDQEDDELSLELDLSQSDYFALGDIEDFDVDKVFGFLAKKDSPLNKEDKKIGMDMGLSGAL